MGSHHGESRCADKLRSLTKHGGLRVTVSHQGHLVTTDTDRHTVPPAIHEVDLLGEGPEGVTKETQSWPQCQPQLPDALLIVNRQKDRPIGWLAPHSEQHRKVLRKMPVWKELQCGDTEQAGLAHPECSVTLWNPMGTEARRLSNPRLAPVHPQGFQYVHRLCSQRPGHELQGGQEQAEAGPRLVQSPAASHPSRPRCAKAKGEAAWVAGKQSLWTA